MKMWYINNSLKTTSLYEGQVESKYENNRYAVLIELFSVVSDILLQ
jgi:hypothetical protein